MTRRNALSCRSARRKTDPRQPACDCFSPHITACELPACTRFERENSHNQVLTRTRAVCLQAASNLKFILPATTKQKPASTPAHICDHLRAHLQARAATADFRPREHDFSTCEHTYDHLRARFFDLRPQYFDLRALSTCKHTRNHLRAHPLTGKQLAQRYFQPDRQCIWHSRTHLRLVHYFEIPQLERLAS